MQAQRVLEEVWEENWQIEDQKEFALAITPKTKFAGILFNLRKKYGDQQSLQLLRETWGESEKIILNNLFKNYY